MKTSDHINELAAALSAAQGGFVNPERNRAVKVKLKDNKGEYTFHYTTLDRIIETIRKPMAENGLSFTQSVTLDSDWAIVTTRIMHASGQWIEDTLPVKPDGFGPQQVGSAITYGKRYSLTALLGIASDEDDDGNLGSGHTTEEIRNSPPPKREKPQSKPADAPPAQTLFQAISEKLKLIDASAADAKDRLNKADDYIYQSFKAKNLTEAENDQLVKAIAEIQKEIDGHKQLDREAAKAAA